MVMLKKTGSAPKKAQHGFAERLKQLRVQKNLSQEDLGVKADLSSIHISRYERGVSRPSAEKLKKLADALEVSGDYLFEGTVEGAARINLSDRKILQLFKDVEELPAEERDYIVRVLDDLLTTRKIRKMTAAG